MQTYALKLCVEGNGHVLTIERRKLTSKPTQRTPHITNTAVMSAAWKAAGLTYVSTELLALPMRVGTGGRWS